MLKLNAKVWFPLLVSFNIAENLLLCLFHSAVKILCRRWGFCCCCCIAESFRSTPTCLSERIHLKLQFNQLQWPSDRVQIVTLDCNSNDRRERDKTTRQETRQDSHHSHQQKVNAKESQLHNKFSQRRRRRRRNDINIVIIILLLLLLQIVLHDN